MGLQRRAHLRSLMNKKSGLSELTVLFSCPNGRWHLQDIYCRIYLGSSCKVKMSDSASLYNQASHSRAAVLDIFSGKARGRLAKQDARARTRSSSGAFACECAELLTESRELCTAARRCGCRAGTARLLFFCRRFLFQIKRKCRNASGIKYLIVS